jgi:hypothetical protein
MIHRHAVTELRRHEPDTGHLGRCQAPGMPGITRCRSLSTALEFWLWDTFRGLYWRLVGEEDAAAEQVGGLRVRTSVVRASDARELEPRRGSVGNTCTACSCSRSVSSTTAAFTGLPPRRFTIRRSYERPARPLRLCSRIVTDQVLTVRRFSRIFRFARRSRSESAGRSRYTASRSDTPGRSAAPGRRYPR